LVKAGSDPQEPCARLSGPALEVAARQLFTDARTHGHWLPRTVELPLLHKLYELVRCGPTSMNTQPMRLKFVVSAEAKQRLVSCLNPGNVAKAQAAPVVVIVGQDLAFPENLPRLFAHKTDARSYYDGKPDFTAATALRNSSLQGGYLILAARLLGLDCGPMSGFDTAAVDREFWAGSSVCTNFLCNLGHGDSTQLKPRLPRLAFDEACDFV
jgi:3-hydroxypropanoate dehydrogenase